MIYLYIYIFVITFYSHLFRVYCNILAQDTCAYIVIVFEFHPVWPQLTDSQRPTATKTFRILHLQPKGDDDEDKVGLPAEASTIDFLSAAKPQQIHPVHQGFLFLTR